jgi:hypothetical protein
MKAILILILLFFLTSWKNNTPDKTYNSALKYSFVEIGDNYIIYEVTKGSVKWYETVASIATAIIPETVQGICLLTIKNRAICAAIYAASKRLVENNYNETKSGIEEGIKFIANKGENPRKNKRSISRATIVTSNINDAKKAGFVFSEYKKLTCVKWNGISVDKKKHSLSISSNGYIAIYNANGYEGSANRTKIFLENNFSNYDFVVFQSWRNEKHNYRRTKVIYKKGYKELALKIAKSIPDTQDLKIDESNDKYILRHSIKVAIFVGKENKL